MNINEFKKVKPYHILEKIYDRFYLSLKCEGINLKYFLLRECI